MELPLLLPHARCAPDEIHSHCTDWTKATGNSHFETEKFPPPTKKFLKILITKNEQFSPGIHVNIISLSVTIVCETVIKRSRHCRMLYHSVIEYNNAIHGVYRKNRTDIRYLAFNQYRYRGFDVAIPFTEKYRIPTIYWIPQIQFVQRLTSVN